jgi:hypothetical protein
MSGLLGNWGSNIEQGLLSALPVLAENDPYKIGQQLLREGAGVGGIAWHGPAHMRNFSEMSELGKVRQARSVQEDIDGVLSGDINAVDFDMRGVGGDVFGYETGDFTHQFKGSGLIMDDNMMGNVHVGKTKQDIDLLKGAETPYDYGKAYGYSDEDIAAFYKARRQGDMGVAEKEWMADRNNYESKAGGMTNKGLLDDTAPKDFNIDNYPSFAERIAWYMQKNKDHKPMDIISGFDDAVFYRQKSGAYTDDPRGMEYSDMSFESIFELRNVMETYYGETLKDVVSSGKHPAIREARRLLKE